MQSPPSYTTRVNAACQWCGGLGAAYSFFDSGIACQCHSLSDGCSASLGLFGFLWIVVCEVSSTSADHAEVIVQMPLVLISSQLTILMWVGLLVEWETLSSHSQ